MVKDIESIFKSAKIVKEAGMISGNPKYYTLNYAKPNEFNKDVLGRIYFKIMFKYDRNASNNFLRMVRDVEDFSPLNFLVNLYSLEANNWKWRKKQMINKSYLQKEDNSEAFPIITEMVSIRDLNEKNNQIKANFLRKFKRKLPVTKEYLGPYSMLLSK